MVHSVTFGRAANHLLQQSTSTQRKQKKTCGMTIISVIRLYEHTFPRGGALELSMQILQSAFELKMEIICERKIVKILTADVDHHRHITVAGGIQSYSCSQYEHCNRLGSSLLRIRPVCTYKTSLNPTTTNVICFSVFL